MGSPKTMVVIKGNNVLDFLVIILQKMDRMIVTEKIIKNISINEELFRILSNPCTPSSITYKKTENKRPINMINPINFKSDLVNVNLIIIMYLFLLNEFKYFVLQF